MSRSAMFTAILPKHGLSERHVRNELKKSLEAEARIVKRELEKTTATWNTRVKFQTKVFFRGDGAFLQVTTNNEVWGYLDRGTGMYGPKKRKYPIFPKRPGGMLRFQSGYSAKTKPGVLGSTGGGSFGNVVHAASVTHPGIKARHWTKAVEKARYKPFRNAIQTGMHRAQQKSKL